MAHPYSFDERQAWIEERDAWRRTLPPSPIPDFLTGIKVRPPDPRDWPAAGDPDIAAAKEAGLPEADDLLRDVKGPPLNQGAIPSCVSHTFAAGQSLFQQQEEALWRVFDAPRVHVETGPVNQGRMPDDILRYAQQRGLPLPGQETRYKIAAYAFVQPGAEWFETIKAALVARKPLGIAYLVPTQFGWEVRDADVLRLSRVFDRRVPR